jgi:hypothetical protein
MNARNYVAAFIGAFGLSSAFGVLLYWSDVQSLVQRIAKAAKTEKGVIWLDSASNDAVAIALPSPLHFVSLPQNLADYRFLGGDTVQAIAVTESLVVAATRGGGVSLSVDNGASWYTASNSNGLPSSSVLSAHIDGERIYVGTERGIAWSDTMGRRWESRTAKTGLGGDVAKVVSVFSRDQMIFAGTAGSGLKISKDAGKTWYSASEKGLDAGYVVSISQAGDSLFAATEKGLFVSRDGGETWPDQIVAGDSGLGSNALLSVSACGGSLYLGTQQGLFKSEDLSGKSWRELSFSGWPPHSGVLSVATLRRLNEAECTVAVGLGGYGVGVSQNGGEGWSFVGSSQGVLGDDVFAVALTQGTLLAGGLRMGVSIGNKDLTQWKRSRPSGAVETPPVWRIFSQLSALHALTQEGVSSSFDGGASWKTVPYSSPIQEERVDGAVWDGKIFVAGPRGLCELAPAGSNWNCQSSNEFGFSENDGRVVDFAFDGRIAVVATERGGIAVSKAGLRGPWELKGTSELGNLAVTSVRIQEGMLLVTTKSTLAYSDDAGESWSKVNFGEFPPVSVDAEGLFFAVALRGGGIALSKDGGKSWMRVSAKQGLISNMVSQVLWNRGMLLVATDSGLATSYDLGKSWCVSTTENGLGSDHVKSVFVSGNRIYVGTDVGVSFVEMTPQ